MTTASRSTRLFAAILTAVCLAACVTTDSDGEVLPRGNQKYHFSEVKEKAKRLKVGMSKGDVLYLLGSPAERNEKGNEWVYLPERPGILIPARALRVEFRDGLLTEHGYHAIILGGQL